MMFAIVHYNTPELTSCLCLSIRKYYPLADIVIFDNSNCRPFVYDDHDVIYYDNTKENLVNFTPVINNSKVKSISNYGSVKHAMSVQWLFDNLSTNDFILCDSDILLYRHLDFLSNKYCAIGTYDKFKGDMPRILPFICYINLHMIKSANIKYFSSDRIAGLSAYPIYDTGASFLEDISKSKLAYKNIDYRNYIIHYGSGSWMKNNTYNAKSWLLTHKALWK